MVVNDRVRDDTLIEKAVIEPLDVRQIPTLKVSADLAVDHAVVAVVCIDLQILRGFFEPDRHIFEDGDLVLRTVCAFNLFRRLGFIVCDDLAEGFVDLGLRSVLRESERAPDRLELSVRAFPLDDSVETSFLGLQARRHQIFLCHFCFLSV